MEPKGWPGVVYHEGGIEHRLPEEVDRDRKGPAGKYGSGFLNPAMAGNRTRSVLMLEHIGKTVFGDVKKIQILDALCATGIRTRRWLEETSEDVSSRLRVKMCDMDVAALEWARLNLENDDLKENVKVIQGDARREILRQGWHWIDLDPYGSPVPFLDLAMQATARRSVISISATDTAALSGSSPGPLSRRYGARVHMDGLKHDSGMRVLLASAAKAAARHDRVIRPLLSVWDSHHLRVTLLVERSKMGASAVEQSLGWRVSSPDDRIVDSAIQAGLLPEHDSGSRPMHVMLPLSAYPNLNTGVSGPLWTGCIGDSDIMASMSEAAAEGICKVDDPDMNQKEVRRAKQAVRRISDESKAIHGRNLVITDALPGFVGGGDPPSPTKMAEILRQGGFCAEVSRYAEPSFRTDAPWSSILQAFKRLS
tara:strand:+ start:4865 stop:6136 length:1272 start_codon:yes stop_codon:yes gene_type:complete